jgi:hypothetical protein
MLLLLLNLAMLIAGAFLPYCRRFIPSESAVWLGLIYGFACGAMLVAGMMGLRRHPESLPRHEYTQLRASLPKGWGAPLLAVVAVAFGTLAFARTLSGVGTHLLGRETTAIFKVSKVRWDRSRGYGGCYR